MWENIAQASWDPDAAFRWAREVENKSHEELHNSSVFTTLDSKLASALSAQITGELQRKLQLFKEQAAVRDMRIKGRQILYLVLEHYRVAPADSTVQDFQDLLHCKLYHNKLEQFIINWERVLLGQKQRPEEHILESVFKEQLERCSLIKI